MECVNEGTRGAFNIRRPQFFLGDELSANFDQDIGWPNYPTYLGNNKLFSLSKKYDIKFHKNYKDDRLSVGLWLQYQSHDNNVYCESLWVADLQPFLTKNGKLVFIDSFLSQKLSIEYKQNSGHGHSFFNHEIGKRYNFHKKNPCMAIGGIVGEKKLTTTIINDKKN
jgi:hypothetical protein